MPKLIKLKHPITLEFCSGQQILTVSKVEPAIVNAAQALADGKRAELTSAWLEFKATGALGRYRQTRDLADCPCPAVDCPSGQILLGTLQELANRIRQRAAARERTAASAVSTWPYASVAD